METAKLIFSNGTELNVQKNGSSFIVPSKPTLPSLENVQIVSAEGTQTINHGQFVECAGLDNNYWFTIIEIPENVIKEQAVDSRITDIEDALCAMTTA